MKVTIFRDYPEEGWPSMEVYADNLISNLKSQISNLQIREHLTLPSFSKKLGYGGLKTRLFFRFLNLSSAPFVQGDVNHIIDQTYAGLLLGINPTKTVITCHDLIPLRLVNWKPKNMSEKAEFLIYKLSIPFLAKAAKIIAVSETTKQDLVKLLQIPKEKIIVISEGVEDSFKPIRSANQLEKVRKKYNLPKNFLLHVGQCSLSKNIETILQTFAVILSHRPARNLFLVKVGGIWEDHQSALIKKLGLGQRILKLSSISRKDLPAIYNLASGLVQVSFFEGFGLTVLEALNCGCPVICSNISPLKELVNNAAILVDPSGKKEIIRAIINLLRDKKLQKDLQKKGLRRAKNFSWKVSAQNTYQVYDEVAKKL